VHKDSNTDLVNTHFITYFICLYNTFYTYCNCILTFFDAYSITFDISQLSSQTIFALLLFLAYFPMFLTLPYVFLYFLVKPLLSSTLYTYSFIYYLLYTSVCTFTHTPQYTSSVLRIFHMICIFLCTICIFTYTTSTIPNLTKY